MLTPICYPEDKLPAAAVIGFACFHRLRRSFPDVI